METVVIHNFHLYEIIKVQSVHNFSFKLVVAREAISKIIMVKS